MHPLLIIYFIELIINWIIMYIIYIRYKDVGIYDNGALFLLSCFPLLSTLFFIAVFIESEKEYKKIIQEKMNSDTKFRRKYNIKKLLK
jgi:hypothetical protein